MRLRFSVCIILSISSCKSSEKNTLASAPESPFAHSELHCRIQLSGENNKMAQIAAKFPSNPGQLAMIYVKRSDREGAQVIASSISPDGIIAFEPNNLDRLAIKLEGTPRIAATVGGFNERQATPCVKLFTSSRSPIARPPTCNALGTPAQGWYQSGKLIKLSPNCDRESLFCGATPIAGWYAQKKTQRILAKSERCGWIRETPICKAGTLATGWHMDDRLIARDDECSYKHMECHGIGTKAEGWYVYERSSPRLLLVGACQTNHDTSYPSH